MRCNNCDCDCELNTTSKIGEALKCIRADLYHKRFDEARGRVNDMLIMLGVEVSQK